MVALNQERKENKMSNISREELSYEVERFLAQKAADDLGPDFEPDPVPYIQEGDVDDVIEAIEALGFKIVAA